MLHKYIYKFESYMLFLDVHRTFRKTSKKINITKFLLNASFGDIDFYFLLTSRDTMVLSNGYIVTIVKDIDLFSQSVAK